MSVPVLWGSRLSPYALKLEAALQYKGIAYRRLPAQGTHFENARLMLRLETAKRLGEVIRYPVVEDAFDEYPLLPYFSYDKRTFEYDSSSILLRMEAEHEGHSIVPNDPAHHFLVRFIDHAFNDFGLYLVHHMRWVGSAKSNRMGRRLAAEFKTALPPGGAWLLSRTFPTRQVKRLPYLMSVAPQGYKAGVKSSLTPPSKQDFPETHTLLEQSWKAILEAMELVLAQQNYLFGDRFTLADASAYGQLGMNLVDPEAAARMKNIAPQTFHWLERIQNGQFVETNRESDAPLQINSRLDNLLNVLMGTYGALMVQNERAFIVAEANGQTRFNETAFDAGEALYIGKLRGYPFRTVIKAFQVRPWRELKQQWQSLNKTDKAIIKQHMQLSELFESTESRK
jgi:glutathione S-transferase